MSRAAHGTIQRSGAAANGDAASVRVGLPRRARRITQVRLRLSLVEAQDEGAIVGSGKGGAIMVEARVAPYGSWKSPITSDLIVAGTVGLGYIRSCSESLFWIELRPTEKGRQVLVRRTTDGRVDDLTPMPFNARTRAHEYGRLPLPGHAARRLFLRTSPISGCTCWRRTRRRGRSRRRRDIRYADCMWDAARERIVCVREDDTHPRDPLGVTTIVSLDPHGRQDARVLVEGSDFYSSPWLSPDGSRLAWLTWNHPNMPWDGTVARGWRRWPATGAWSISISEVALNVLDTEDQEQIIGTASHWSTECPAPFAAQLAEIEVDIETGEITVKKLVMAVDCGVPINPMTASSQVEGGMVQSLGYAMCEETLLDDLGRPLNAEFGPYWIFRSDDTPETEVFLVQTMEPSGPFGAKSIAEIVIDAVAPAVRNALLDATGVTIEQTPFTPERVWRALRGQAGALT